MSNGDVDCFARGRREVGLQARHGGMRILLVSMGFLLFITKATPAIRRRGNVRGSSYRTCSIFHIVTCTIGEVQPLRVAQDLFRDMLRLRIDVLVWRAALEARDGSLFP